GRIDRRSLGTGAHMDIAHRKPSRRPDQTTAFDQGWTVLAVALAYYVGAEIAFAIGTLSDRIFAPFWPPNIVLFCALMVTRFERWWVYILAAFPAHVIAELRIGMGAQQLLVAFVSNGLVAVVNAYAVRRLLRRPPWFSSLRKMLLYIAITV